MVIDASALVAILAEEDEAHAFLEKMHGARERLVSPIALYETTAAIVRIQSVVG